MESSDSLDKTELISFNNEINVNHNHTDPNIQYSDNIFNDFPFDNHSIKSKVAKIKNNKN